MRRLVVFVAALGAATTVVAAPAVAAETPERPAEAPAAAPPMGWNSWNKFACNINEQLIRETADALVSSGMKDAGYQYVNIDDCWAELNRNAEGKLENHKTRFPSGIKALADYIHGKGLKLGIYTSAGTLTCAKTMPGALDHEDVDAQTFADWGVDYLKYDNCNNQGRPALERYTKMGEALKKTGRPIVYALCEWGQNKPWTWGKDAGAQLWRTTGDIKDNWGSWTGILDKQVGLEAYSGPGAWNDPDMLEVGNGGMTNDEYQAHFALWSLMNAPLLAGNDLRSQSEATKKILQNKDLIAINQDWGGKQGHKVRDDGDNEVWAKPMSDGSTAVVLFNRGTKSSSISTLPAEIGAATASGYRVRDLWTGAETETTGTLRAAVPSHGAAAFRIWPSKFPSAAPRTTLSVQAADFTPRDKPFTTSVELTNDGSTPAFLGKVSLTAPTGWKVDGRADEFVLVVLPGKSWKHTWTVSPVAPAGDKVSVTSHTEYWTLWGKQALDTDGTTPLVTAPAAGTTALSQAAWISAENGFGPVERGKSNGESKAGDGKPITIGGVVYPNGLGVHAPSKVRFYLGGGCKSFSSIVGLDDEKKIGTVAFAVLGDGKTLASTEVLKTGQSQPIDVTLTGVQVLDLVVTDGGDGNNSDHADWANASITC
ncbi:alpha-galactosidase [Amycolatopsis xylanica]|uniref:Alpha-galactosidase n=1 Tax=Amycolatopsis xylanica TaxID=589385 RepID=A0A1H3DX10_9PSEU|nr:NPCBM/NEW2 domain-containing protein [Amycolatopsis xylanica]SDX71052.1 alpha-galactosidase [Amycolatopsis xylanica]